MDIIPDYSKLQEIELSGEEKYEETKINYERYRSVIISEFNNVPESEVLSKIDVDELYSDVKRSRKGNKKQSKNKSAISYDYDSQQQITAGTNKKKKLEDDDKDSNDETEDEMDFDIDTFSSGQIDKLNVLALDYKVSQGYFSRSVRSEKNLLMERKQAKMAELEKSNLSGKKARKERRLFKEMSLRTRIPSPPLFVPKDIYNAKKQRENDEESNTSSSSGSVSLDSKPQFITEFGTDIPSLPTSSSTLDHVTKPRLPSSSSARKKRRRNSSSSSSSSRSDSSSPRRKKHSHHSSSSHYGDRDKERRTYSSSGRDHSKWRRSRSRSVECVSALTKSKLEGKKPQPKKSLPSLQQKQQPDKTKLTPQERLKKKMQSQLSKTFKEDKKVEKYKAEAKEVERIEREEKMKQETIKLRRRGGYDDFYERSSRYSRSPSPHDRYHRH